MFICDYRKKQTSSKKGEKDGKKGKGKKKKDESDSSAVEVISSDDEDSDVNKKKKKRKRDDSSSSVSYRFINQHWIVVKKKLIKIRVPNGLENLEMKKCIFQTWKNHGIYLSALKLVIIVAYR